MELPADPRKVCFNPHNYYSRTMMIYDSGSTLSQVQACTHEKLYIFFSRTITVKAQVVFLVFCSLYRSKNINAFHTRITYKILYHNIIEMQRNISRP